MRTAEVCRTGTRTGSITRKARLCGGFVERKPPPSPPSLRTFVDFQTACIKLGCDLELGLHLRNLIVFATGRSRFLTVGNLSIEQLQAAWNESRAGMESQQAEQHVNSGLTLYGLRYTVAVILRECGYDDRRRIGLEDHRNGAPLCARRRRQKDDRRRQEV